jgi:hypothetical protein
VGPGTVSFRWKAQLDCGAFASFRVTGGSGVWPHASELNATTDWQWVTCFFGDGPQELIWVVYGNCDDSEQASVWLDEVVITGPGLESPPMFTTAPAPQSVPAGTNVAFQGVAAGYPLPTLQWYLQGAPLPGETNFTLALPNVQSAHGGLYEVVATSALGAVTNAALLTVLPSEPVILVQPSALTVTFGLSAQFAVAAQGTAPLTYQWRFNGLELVGATNALLALEPVTANQAGTYSVVVGNSVGAVSSSEATLSVVRVAAWGENAFGQTDVPPEARDVVGLAGGSGHSLALLSNGRLLAWGDTTWNAPSDIPADLVDAAQIGAGGWHSLAVRSNGTVVSWGFNSSGQTNVPEDLGNVVAVAGGLRHSIALKNDGTVAAWGYEPYAQPSVAATLSGVSAIAAGVYHNLALRSNGTVVAWGEPGKQSEVSPNVVDIIAVAAGAGHSVVLRSDGYVFAWGTNDFGQCNVPVTATNVVAIAAGDNHTVALRADGSVLAWGDDRYGQATVPPNLPAVAAIAAGRAHTLALLGAAPPLPSPELFPEYASGSAEFRATFATVSGRTYFLEVNSTLDPSGWLPIAVLFGDGTTRSFTDSAAPSGGRFYRVRVE